MKLIGKLVLAQFRRRWVRTSLALSAVITSVAMVVVVIGNQTAVVRRPDASAMKAVGPFDVVITAGDDEDVIADRRRAGANPPLPPLDSALLEWLNKSPLVTTVRPQCEMVIEVRNLSPEAMMKIPVTAPQLFRAAPKPGTLEGTVASLTPGFVPPEPMQLIGTNDAQPVRPIDTGEWLDAAQPDAVVLDSDVAKRFRKKVGDTLDLTSVTGMTSVKIVGVLKTPITLRGFNGIYARAPLFEKLSGQTMSPNRALVTLAPGVSTTEFETAFITQLTPERQAQVENVEKLLSDLAIAAAPLATGAWAFPLTRDGGVKLAVIGAFFVIFNTFSMGLRERTRLLGMLRAIGMTRGQIVATFGCEALLIALLGWTIGMAVGIYLLNGSAAVTTFAGLTLRPEFDYLTLAALGAAGSFGAIALATCIPLVLASRKRPLEGIADIDHLTPQTPPWWLAAVGGVLIAINPLAALLVPSDPDPRTPGVLVPLSYLAALIGFVLIIPTLLRLLEPLFVQVVAKLLWLNPRLMARQLSANLWRTVGCVSALMVGLGLYLLVYIWGFSMAEPFLIREAPDAVVIVSPDGMPPQRLAALSKIDGVTTALPMFIENPMLADLPSEIPVSGWDFFSKDMMYVGCDVSTLMHGMFDGHFVRGNEQEALAALARGDSCLITDNLWRRVPYKYDVGQTITMMTDEIPRREVVLKIAGVVKMDGWHQFSQRTRMRRNTGRSGGLVMVPPETLKAAYPNAAYNMFWFELTADTQAAALEAPVLRILGSPTDDPTTAAINAPVGDDEILRTARQRAYCQVIDTRAVASVQHQLIAKIIDDIAFYPYIALLLSSAAVINTISASVRVRAWEIGVLRGIGLTRGQVVRQILAEGLLIGLLACATSFLFALLATKAGIFAATGSMNVSAPFLLPWREIGEGMATALIVCLLASAIPAWLLVRTEPLRLLQDGRAGS